MPLKSKLIELIPGLCHGFGDASEELPREVMLSWQTRQPIWKQVHGTAGVEVTQAAQSCGEVDALWTRLPGQPVGVVSADCVPILLSRKDGSAVAAIHAGWRGTRSGIVTKLVEAWIRAGLDPAEWVVAIGPAIGPCCYEVSEERADDFRNSFARFGADVAVPRHRHLDLPEINRQLCVEAGISMVDLLRACTRCTTHPTDPKTPTYNSYRRNGPGTRQWSVIVAV